MVVLRAFLLPMVKLSHQEHICGAGHANQHSKEPVDHKLVLLLPLHHDASVQHTLGRWVFNRYKNDLRRSATPQRVAPAGACFHEGQEEEEEAKQAHAVGRRLSQDCSAG